MIEQTLHGLVVGLGKIRKDGSKEFHWLDKPIHNRIVSGGLDEYFMFNGSPTAVVSDSYADRLNNRFLPTEYSGTYSTTGLLQYLAIGTDGTPTEFTDTALKSQIGGYSNSDVGYRQLPYFGFRLNDDDSMSIRVPRVSATVESATTIRELGWFEKYTTSDTYVMFSRVVLPTSIELDAGDRLSVVYQLNITYNNLAENEVSPYLLQGMLDSDGNQLHGLGSYRMYFAGNSVRGTYAVPPTRGVWYLGLGGTAGEFPSYQGTFLGIGGYNYYGTIQYPIYGNKPFVPKGYQILAPFNTHQTDKVFTYTTDANWTIGEQFGYRYTSYSTYSDQLTESALNITSANPKDYIPGTYYRDRDIVISPAWPNMNAEQYQDIYAICHNAYLIRFGYYDNTDPDNPVWVPKPWRKQFGQSYKFTFRYKLSTADTV